MADANLDAEGSGQEPLPLRLLDHIVVLLGGLALLAMMGLSVGDAFLRSFFNRPIFGAHDLTQVLLAFTVALALPACVAAGRAIAIDTLVRQLPAHHQRAVALGVSVTGAAALGLLAWRCFQNGLVAAQFGEATFLLQIPFGPAYHALAIGALLSAILLLVRPGGSGHG